MTTETLVGAEAMAVTIVDLETDPRAGIEAEAVGLETAGPFTGIRMK